MKMLNGLNKSDAGSITMWGREGGPFARLSALDARLSTSHQWLRARAHEKGTGALGGAEHGCRRQARRASRVGFRLGERYRSERRTANQIDAKSIDFAEDSFAPADADSPSTGKIKCSKGIEHF